MKLYNGFILKNERIPLIVYPFEGIEKVFDNRKELKTDISKVFKGIENFVFLPNDVKYALFFPWTSENSDLNYDTFFYHDFEGKWTDVNPVAKAFPVRDYLLDSGDSEFCINASQIIGDEARMWRRTKDLEEYLVLDRRVQDEMIAVGRWF